jgi:hypothetical protein
VLGCCRDKVILATLEEDQVAEAEQRLAQISVCRLGEGSDLEHQSDQFPAVISDGARP